MAEEDERNRVDSWLRKNGVPYGIGDLYHAPALSPECVPQLVELLKSPLSLRTAVLVSKALFARKPKSLQKREAVGSVIAIVKNHVGEYNALLSTLVLNDIGRNANSRNLDEIGRMALDKRYGELRDDLTSVLGKIGDAKAIPFLLRLADEPFTAAVALDGLARLRFDGTLNLCQKALQGPRLDKESRDAIRETCSELKRRIRERTRSWIHVTKGAVPKDLEEWSANLGRSDLPGVLRGVQKCVESGFGKSETSEVLAAADALSPDQTVRFKFAVKFQGKETGLWLEFFCDDENADDLYAFGGAELIGRIEEELEKILKYP